MLTEICPRLSRVVSLADTLTVSAGQAQEVIYVDETASGPHHRASWCAAYTSVQEALDLATSGDPIRITDGV